MELNCLNRHHKHILSCIPWFTVNCNLKIILIKNFSFTQNTSSHFPTSHNIHIKLKYIFFQIFFNPDSPQNEENLGHHINVLIDFKDKNHGNLPTLQHALILCINPYLQGDTLINALAKHQRISVKTSVLRCT